MLWQRVVTALLLLPLILGAIFALPNAVFAWVIAVPVLLAGREWADMATGNRGLFMVLLVLGMLLTGGAERAVPGAGTFLLWAAALFWVLALVKVLRYPRLAWRWYESPVRMHLAGLLMLLPAWHAVVLLQGLTHGGWWLLGGFVIVWGADVGAYFAGRAFGKRKLAPQVSPGKSWAGFFGGLATTLALAVAVASYLGARDLVPVLLLVCVVTLASVLGDLVESMVKREAGVKDSGNLLPGHGGMLDRIDSVTCALPVYALGLSLLELGA